MHVLLLDPQRIIETFGLLGIGLAVFAECGLFFGIFLPGDSLLFTAGFLASTGLLPISPLIIVVIFASMAGNILGFSIGMKAGARLEGQSYRFVKKEYFEKTKKFFDRHGRMSIIFARFIPIVRTLIPPLAGVGRMTFSSFVISSIVGGALWGTLLPLLGYTLGRTVPNIDHYILPIVLFITFISLTPTLYGLARLVFKNRE